MTDFAILLDADGAVLMDAAGSTLVEIVAPPASDFVDPDPVSSEAASIIPAAAVASLLPANATRLERAIETLISQMLDLHCPVGALWSPQACPSALLPYLAWALSVDEWDSSWTEARKREVIAASIEIQRHKGTPWAIRRSLDLLGYGSAQIFERYAASRLDGTWLLDGSRSLSTSDHWAEYRVYLDAPITNKQAARVRKLLSSVAPAGCHLKELNYTRALNTLDGSWLLDGTYTLGVA